MTLQNVEWTYKVAENGKINIIILVIFSKEKMLYCLLLNFSLTHEQ